MQESSEKNIVLVGMMGAGKSYIGKKLAKLLAHFRYIDIDAEIENEQKMSISEIFEKFSEKHFRELETAMIKKIAANKNQIIATGGGVCENPQNIALLKQNGIIFYLKAPVVELFDRIKDETHRPLLKSSFSVETLREILKKREKNYKRADFVIDTNKQRAYTILNDIIKEYEDHEKK